MFITKKRVINQLDFSDYSENSDALACVKLQNSSECQAAANCIDLYSKSRTTVSLKE